MINGKSVLAIIPARGGSKGVPRKNIRQVAGKPLIAWTIEEAKKSRYINRLILSSEDAEIIKVAKKWGCEVPFIRPTELAQDNTPGVDVVLHAIQMLPGYDYVLLIQPTSPLRTVQDIDGCLEMCLESKAKACVSVTEVDKSPNWMYYLRSDNKMQPVLENNESYPCRQDHPKVYVINGAIYIADCNWLLDKRTFRSKETLAYVMPKERSVDIDDEMDIIFAEFLIEKL